MTPCGRTWEAAALEDGRLSAAQGSSFERHAASCAVCLEEQRVLARLQQAAELLPVSESTPLARRRAANELLRRANEQMMQRARVSWPWKAAAIAGVLAAVFVWRLSVEDVLDVEITASSGAKWSTSARGAASRARLSRGRFELEVQAVHAGERFVVELPDGELEVKGTRFVVEVDGVRTNSVRVDEGHVELRLAGRAAVSLRAGNSWAPEVEAVIVPESPREVVREAKIAGKKKIAGKAIEPGKVIEPIEPVVLNEPVVPIAPVEPVELIREEAPVPAKPSAGAIFKRAMDAFSAGDFGVAEQSFAELARDHPADARVEDAMFLLAVARSRRGDVEGAAQLAREYLARYPRGLRRADAERLVEASSGACSPTCP
jgi:hypothetical protein